MIVSIVLLAERDVRVRVVRMTRCFEDFDEKQSDGRSDWKLSRSAFVQGTSSC